MVNWEKITTEELKQGNVIIQCPVPLIGEDFAFAEGDKEVDIEVRPKDVIIITQSCDLANKKIKFVALCPIDSITKFLEFNPNLNNGTELEKIRRGERHSLHMMSGFNSNSNMDTFIVDFREIYSVPVTFLKKFVSGKERYSLTSPYLEHFAQAFARFFMRVGLPGEIPSFITKKGSSVK